MLAYLRKIRPLATDEQAYGVRVLEWVLGEEVKPGTIRKPLLPGQKPKPGETYAIPDEMPQGKDGPQDLGKAFADRLKKETKKD